MAIGSQLDFRRILVLVLLAVAAFRQVQGTPESQADEDEDPSPSVHDCRFHVEAALREYWTRRGSEPPLQQSKPSDQPPQNLTDEPGIEQEHGIHGAQPETGDVEYDAGSDHEGGGEEQAEETAQETSATDDDHYKEGDIEEGYEEAEEEYVRSEEGADEETEEHVEESADAVEGEESEVTESVEAKPEDEYGYEEEGGGGEEEPVAGEYKDGEDIKHADEEEESGQVTEEQAAQDEEIEAEAAGEEQNEDEGEKSDHADEMVEDEAASAEEAVGDDAEEGEESAQQADEAGEDEGSPEEEESDASLQEPSEESDISETGVEQELPSDEPEAEQPEAEGGAREEEKEGGEEGQQADEPAEAEKEEVEVVEEEETEEEKAVRRRKGIRLRSRRHIDDILGIHEMGSDGDTEEQRLINSILKELKRLYETAIKPLESTYKYRDISTRLLGEAEVFGKPTVLFLGPWSSGKSTIINFLLGTEFTHTARKTGPELTDTDFTIVAHGDKYQTVSGTEIAADWAFSGIQKFGQDFLDHVHGVHIPSKLLQRVTLVDTPGIIENRKQTERGYPFNDAFQWFIDRADAIYVVFDPSKLEIGPELEAILDQLKGRESQVRFILNKADSIQQNEIMKVVGQLMWNLSPLMGSADAPVIYAVSLSAKPFQPRAPLEFLLDQEMSFLEDLRETIDKRVENRIAYARRHAVRVRNHAKMVDCYLSTFYKHKSIFSNKKKVAQDITENPNQYSIYQGLSSLSNVSRYDLPDPEVYKDFFKLNPLYEFKPISSTCSYFRGCPLDKLDIAIAYELPELLGKYKKNTKTNYYVQEREVEEAESR